MAAVMVARQGRDLQRYSASTGGRIVVGCIPYRGTPDNVKVLVICSRKKGASAGVMFPKGGWELDESMVEAARREALEEAGVRGETGDAPLGRWCYRSRRYDATYEGYMFPLRVTDELERWPQMSGRGRSWVYVREAMERCPHWWMREALQRLVGRLNAALYTIDEPSITTSNPLPTIGSVVDESITSSNTSPQMDSAMSSPDLHLSDNFERKLEKQCSGPHEIPLQHLKEITDNFSNERILGQGGFGVVYKGVLQNGKIIAVKKIVSSFMPSMQRQFENEVCHLMMLKHPNIVRCMGYCYETRNQCLEYDGRYVFAEMAERLLCLEYLHKGSLDKYISDESSGLDWSTRYKIIGGICYGLCHLHEQNNEPIVHMDLKPANILLDDGMVPKITDFGLSRLLDQQKTIYTTSRDGTFGYMAPEFLHGGTITPKSDIFSLGVIIMEIVTGNRDYPDVTKTSSNDFIKLVLNNWRSSLQKSTGCGSLQTYCQQIQICLHVGLICVNPDRTKRPPIRKVISMLQGFESIDCDIMNEVA